jgi:hypothetical protein
MFVIFFVLSQFTLPTMVKVAVGLVGGILMVLMGVAGFSQPPQTRNHSSGV